MLTLSQYIKQQDQLLFNYRAFLKQAQLSYGHEKKLINEIKRIEHLQSTIYKMTPIERQQLINESVLIIERTMKSK